MKESLRLKGGIVERNTKEVLDMLVACMRNACRDPNLDIITRLNLLEILELRLNSWHADPALAALYRYFDCNEKPKCNVILLHLVAKSSCPSSGPRTRAWLSLVYNIL